MKAQIKLSWHTEKRKIKDLIPTEGNPRQLTEKQAKDLQQSLERFNLVDIPAINTNNRIISGHQRISILKAINNNGQEIDVRVPNRTLTEEEHREYMLRANRNIGEWDYDLLANFDEDILKDIGFDSQELDRIFQLNPQPQDDDVPDERKTNIKLGDMFQLGKNRLLCGDATKQEDVAKLMGDEKAGIVVTDPPYNITYQGSRNSRGKVICKRLILNDNLSAEQFKSFLTDSITNMMAVCDGAFYICMGSKELATTKEAFEQSGGHWQSYIIWVKNHFTLSRADYQHLYEPILYGWNKSTKRHYFIDDRTSGNVWYDMGRKAKFEGGKTILHIGGVKIEIDGKVTGRILKGTRKLDIWHYDRPMKSEEHPTMKPVALCQEAIQNSSHRDSIVLDVFGGSGSTLIACEKLNRQCRMMEISEIYCQVIIDRWEQFSKKKATKLSGK